MAPSPPRTLVELLRHRASRQPDAPAYVLGQERVTFGALLIAATRLARALVAEGLGPGQRVALALPAGTGLAKLYFAVQLAGASPGLLSPALPAPALARRVARLQPSLLIDAGASGRQSANGWRVLDAAQLQARSQSAAAATVELPPPPDPEAIAHLQLTSGTTGEPRAAMLDHRAVVAYLRIAGDTYGLSAADRIVAWVPPWHDMGLFYGLLYPVAFGCTGFLVEPAIHTLGEWLETLSRARGTFTGAPDFAYRLACRLVRPAGLDLSCLRVATCGGEPVRRSTIEEFEARFAVPGRVRPAYGLAEATLGVSVSLAGPRRAHGSGALSCGPPMAGVEIRIVREDGSEAAAGEEGEILVRSPALFSGYLDAAAETRRALADGWLRTGDGGLVDERGELYVLGRRRCLLKRAGAAIAPREIEEVADAVAGVRLSAAVAGDDRILVVAETAAAQQAPRLAADVAEAVRAALGFRPAVAVVAPRTIPRSENGKVQHERLRAAVAAGLPAGLLLFSTAAG